MPAISSSTHSSRRGNGPTCAELRQRAKTLGVRRYSQMRKDELQQAVKEKEGSSAVRNNNTQCTSKCPSGPAWNKVLAFATTNMRADSAEDARHLKQLAHKALQTMKR